MIKKSCENVSVSEVLKAKKAKVKKVEPNNELVCTGCKKSYKTKKSFDNHTCKNKGERADGPKTKNNLSKDESNSWKNVSKENKSKHKSNVPNSLSKSKSKSNVSVNDSFRRKRSEIRQRVRTIVKTLNPNVRHSKVNTKNLSYLVCNVRGYSSKKAAINNILSASDIDIVMMSETHLYNGRKPKHPDYTFIGRSRDKVNSKGGVAIGFKRELGAQMVKVREGKGSNEFILVKCTAVEPPIVFGVMYGIQENTNPDTEVRENLAELFAAIDEYRSQGCDVIIGGDLNVHVGEAIQGNDPKVSKGGKLLVELCQDFDMEIINKQIQGNKMTHIDASGGVSRVLDYVISNLVSEHVRIEIDHDLNMTPFIPKLKRDREGKAVWQNSYSDHRSIIGEIEVVRKSDKIKPKIRQWRLNRPGGKDKYRELTDLYADYAYNMIMSCPDTESMFSRLQDLINICESLSVLHILSWTHNWHKARTYHGILYNFFNQQRGKQQITWIHIIKHGLFIEVGQV